MQRAVFGRGREKRRTTRRPGTAKGLLAFSKGAAAVACLVRDFSAMGARIEVQKKISVPDVVFLIFPDLNRAYQANVSWQRVVSMGLRFTDVIDLNEDLPLDLRFLKWIASDQNQSAVR
jgi:hypothetical protein